MCVRNYRKAAGSVSNKKKTLHKHPTLHVSRDFASLAAVPSHGCTPLVNIIFREYTMPLDPLFVRPTPIPTSPAYIF